jgi:hypothetical protein
LSPPRRHPRPLRHRARFRRRLLRPRPRSLRSRRQPCNQHPHPHPHPHPRRNSRTTGKDLLPPSPPGGSHSSRPPPPCASKPGARHTIRDARSSEITLGVRVASGAAAVGDVYYFLHEWLAEFYVL